jgi:hypothetical protein
MLKPIPQGRGDPSRGPSSARALRSLPRGGELDRKNAVETLYRVLNSIKRGEIAPDQLAVLYRRPLTPEENSEGGHTFGCRRYIIQSCLTSSDELFLIAAAHDTVMRELNYD